MRKRAFDYVVVCLAAVVWVPVVLTASLAVLVFSGRPILYRSRRWVGRGTAIEMAKLRVMVPNADLTPASTDTGRFLNTPPDSPLYTGVGRILDRIGLNEIPQFVHVLKGEMSLIGARPLTDRVHAALIEEHSSLDDRWLTPAGLTGLPQLVGRMDLTDDQRLQLESSYARSASTRYSLRLDFMILVYTVLITFRLKRPLTFEAALGMIPPARARRRRIEPAQLSPAACEVEVDAVA